MFGGAPQEIRTWVIAGTPVAWIFHYLHAVPFPIGFPPSVKDLMQIEAMAKLVASPFASLLIAADFVRDSRGKWYFLEAGRGAVAGTAHGKVFKHVALTMSGKSSDLIADDVGGPF